MKDRLEFTDDVRQEEVTQPRLLATSTRPYLQAVAPTPAAANIIRSSSGQLQVIVSRQLPADELSLGDEAIARLNVQRVDDMCKRFSATKQGPTMLDEIAALPNNVILRPNQTKANLATLPRVKIIGVSLLTEFVVNPGAVGVDDKLGNLVGPMRPASAYTLQVRILTDLSSDPADWRSFYFPGGDGLPKERYITWGWKSSASRMAATLLHELLHVWFLYKYWYILESDKSDVPFTGHGDYKDHFDANDTFWDGIKSGRNVIFPFEERLAAFYNELDTIESAHAPPFPDPPWIH